MKIQILLSFIFLLISVTVYSQNEIQLDSSQVIFERVEKEAEFPGGVEGWRNFLVRNLNANVPVDNSAPTGIYTVMVLFVVDKNGAVSEIKAMTNLGYGMEQEVIRILRKSGNWEPAIQNERPVKAYRRQPVTFMVTEEGFDISPLSITSGKENEIAIEVDKVKSEDLNVIISRGTIKPVGDGKFIVKVNGNSRVIVRVYNTKKKNKEVGAASLEVKD